MLKSEFRISDQEKRKALETVLESDTFARADQVKSFLRYVCEMEIAGRAQEISEYLVGVEALHKPAGFSTADDTSVRNRAYALRKKLDRYYADEYPDAPIRIEFTKGTYIPRFVDVASLEDPFAAEDSPAPVPPPQSAGLRHGRWRYAAVLALGVALGTLATLLAFHATPSAHAPLDPLIREAWGPVVQPGATPLICLGSAASLTLLPFDVKVEWQPQMPVFTAPLEVYPWYLRYHHLTPGEQLYMAPDVNSPHFGDVLGVIRAERLLAAAGAVPELLPERLVPTAALGDRDTILFGVPHKSEAVLRYLKDGAFQFSYDPQARDVVITRAATGKQPARRWESRRDARDERSQSYALITVDRGARMLAFSGDPSAGAAAAVEYFASPQHLAALRDRFRAEGMKGFPSAYQVLVRATLAQNFPLACEYEDHAVLRRK